MTANVEAVRYVNGLFSVEGKVAVVTGATGLLGGAMARGLAKAGASVGILGRRGALAAEIASEIEGAGGRAIPLQADVCVRDDLESARQAVLDRWGRVDILVNAAGGLFPDATLGDGKTFFNVDSSAFERVFDLNFTGTLLPTQVFAESMVSRIAADPSPNETGSVVNISSVTVPRAVTRVMAYGAAKAAVEHFTRWLAADVARNYDERLRVNAIAPGYFLSEMNRPLLMNPDGTPGERGSKVLAHTPSGRFGQPDELIGTLIWLCSPSSTFVNGVVVQVDGGFSSFSGI